MNLVIFGARQFYSLGLVRQIVESTSLFKNGEIDNVICGMARGADSLGKMWAESRGINVIPYRADWEKNGRAAGHIRNGEMARDSDKGIGFWTGVKEKCGTYDMIGQCVNLDIPLLIYRLDKKEVEFVLSLDDYKKL